jgi:uroporphyrinogen-III synthase
MTNTQKGAVLITRPKEDAEILSHQLNEFNIPHMIASMMEVKQEALTAPVRAALKQSPLQGIILTSRHAAVCLASIDISKELPVYAVGDATAKSAQDAGFTNISTTGNTAESLYEYISTHNTANAGSLFYPHGYDLAFDMEGELIAKGFSVIGAQAYNAEKIETLSSHFIHSLTSGEISHVTFFSKRTAQSYQDRMLKFGLEEPHRNMTALCIRDTLVSAISGLTWRDIKSATAPSYESMLELIRNSY